MTLRHPDPFIDPTIGLDPEVNPYVSVLKNGLERGELPLSFGPDMKRFRGQWRSVFAKQMGVPPAQVVCEIGCYKGTTLCEMARAHPDKAFVGLDITFKRVVTTARKAKEQGLTNVISVLANGKALNKLFAPEELDGFVMFFPDPWSKKKRQRKNRLFNEDFARELAPLIKESGFVWFKSDQEDYVQDAMSHLAPLPFQPVRPTHGLLTETYVTTFEALFTKQNLPTFAFQWTKSAVIQSEEQCVSMSASE